MLSIKRSLPGTLGPADSSLPFIATAVSVILFQLMMHQGKAGALPPLHASTFTKSLRSQSQNAACHVGALEVHRMTCNPLHLATQSQPINSQSKGDQGQGSPG